MILDLQVPQRDVLKQLASVSITRVSIALKFGNGQASQSKLAIFRDAHGLEHLPFFEHRLQQIQ